MVKDDTCFEAAVEKIIATVGKKIVLGVPLGLGKPIGLLNALYRAAVSDPSIELTIITGLTLSRPPLHNALEKRLVEPILQRLLLDFEDPLYEKARELQQLPTNIQVIEFFLTPGKFLHNAYVQQNYISSNYSSVVRDTLYYSVNVLAQLVVRSNENPELLSLSCNTDLFHDMVKQIQQENRPVFTIAEVNANLPYMTGEAVMRADFFSSVVDSGHYKALFAMPRDELTAAEHLIGLYTSCLVKDGSCLQIGIGRLSNGIASALIFRQQENSLYRQFLSKLSVTEKFGETIASVGSLSCFDEGLYASTEMLSDEYIHLYNESILKKRVYDHVGLQTLLNAKKITEEVTPELIDVLLENAVIQEKLTEVDLAFLVEYGIIDSSEDYKKASQVKKDILKQHSKRKLKSGKIIHAGFFIGTRNFYQELKHLSPEASEHISMTSISRTNTVSWSPELSRLQRQHARLVNSSMMVTLGGIVISDGLQNLNEVSGIGGQFNFVMMANDLPGARSIIICNSVRHQGKKVFSNIVWEYANLTVPRCFRDIVITEYGIADLRSKTDAEIIKAMLAISDSRFQPELMRQAKQFGKLPPDYQIPALFQQNYPERISPVIQDIQQHGFCLPYPFGSDLTLDEEVLKKALLRLKSMSKMKLVFLLCVEIFSFRRLKTLEKYLMRMQLNHPRSFKEWIDKKLVLIAVRSVI